MGDSLNIPTPVVLVLLAAMGIGTGAGTSLLSGNNVLERLDSLEIKLNCFGRHNAKRGIRYWEGQGDLSPDQADMYNEQKELLAYYKNQLLLADAPPCVI